MRIPQSRLRRLMRRDKGRSSVDMVPFCGLLLRVLTVFMIASPMTLGGVKIDLPKGRAEIVVIKREPVAITIQKDGTVYVEKSQIRLSSLGSRLNEMTAGNKDAKIFVLADKDIAYNRVITVVSTVYSAGFFDVTLVTELHRL